MATTKPVLNLSTLTEHPVVVIDGQRYVLSPPDALTIVEYDKVIRLLPRLSLLWNAKAPLTTAEEEELGGFFKSLCEIVLKAPAAVHDKLTDLQRVAVYVAFLKLPHSNNPLLAAAHRNGRGGKAGDSLRKMRSTGVKRSLGSRGSMAAIRSSGSRRNRTASSGPVS